MGETLAMYAWCDEGDRVDALESTLSALAFPQETCSIALWSMVRVPGAHGGAVASWRDASVTDAIGALRNRFDKNAFVLGSVPVTLASGGVTTVLVNLYGEEHERRHPLGPLVALVEAPALIPGRLTTPVNASRSLYAEATMGALQTYHDIEELFSRFCAVGPTSRITTAALTSEGSWKAPIEGAAFFSPDGRSVARGLALSWLQVHDKDRVERIAGLSDPELRTRVESSPHDARVGVAGEIALRREVVIRALDLPPPSFLDALEAAAVADPDWLAAEREAQMLSVGDSGAPTYDIDVASRKHRQFLERHAPFHLRRLSDGGVMIITHPFRTLWPLYADALRLLGIF